MKLRSASLLDLSRIEAIYHEATTRFGSVPPPARLWSLVSHTLSALLPLSQETLLYVAEEGGRVIGFVQASGQPLGFGIPNRITSLQVLNVCVAADRDEPEVAPALVDYLCGQAMGRGVQRLFVRIPPDDVLTPIFRRQSFRQYATETVLYAEHPVATGGDPPGGLRGVRGRDGRLLYHLYRRVTPIDVSHVEAPTYRDWRALRSAPGQQELVDRVEVVGWCQVQRSGSDRPHTLSFMALPEAGLAGELADHAITTVGGQPSWSSLRHYDAEMIGALRGRGFSTLLTQALLVRELLARNRVAEKGLVPLFG